MKIYVAGKWDNKNQILQKMIELEKMGHNITHKWPTVEVVQGERDAEMALHDVNGVKESELLLVLMDDAEYVYRGTFTEIGVALGLNIKTWIVCPHENAYCKTNIFFHHPNIVHFQSWDDAVNSLDD
jgi:nucleoside 2-deoxyribosyltransferase